MKTTMWHGNVRVTATSRSGGLTWVFAVLVLGFLAWLGSTVMTALNEAVGGVRESAATANVVLSTLVGSAVLIAVVGGGTWALVRRHQAARARPLEQAARELVSRDIASAQLDRARQRRAIEAPPVRPVDPYRLVVDHAGRLRLPRDGSGRR